MRKLTESEYKSVTKGILEYFDSFCRNANLKYFVAYGTLIGAIRHGGFIPWDDDIDVCMLREDYDRFIMLHNQTNHSRYYILSAESKKSSSYYNNYARLCDGRIKCEIKGTYDVEKLGAFIDIFPLDNVPNNKQKRIELYDDVASAFYDLVYSLPFRCYRTMPFKRAVRHLISFRRIINWTKGFEKLKDIRDNIMTRYNGQETEYVCCLFDNNPSDKLMMYKSDAIRLTRHTFEDIEVNIPENYDEILRSYYGDYMQLPPENERYSKHHFIPYWSEISNDKG